MKYKIVLTLFLFFSHFLFAAKIDEEIDKLKKISKLLDKQFWKIKQDNLQQREEYDDTLQNIDEQIKTAYLKKNNLTEELYLIKENLAKIKEQLEVANNKRQEFKNTVEDRIEAEAKKLDFGYPYLLNQKLPTINELRKKLSLYSLAPVIEELLNYKADLIEEAEKIEVGSSIYINEQNNERFTAPYIRAGWIHQSYSSDSQSAVLLRETSIKGVRYNWETKITGELRDKIDSAIARVVNDNGKNRLAQIPIDPAQSGKKLESFLKGDLSGLGAKITQFFIGGGVIMYPMSILLLLGLFTFFERLIFYQKNSLKKFIFIDEVVKFINNNEKDKACELIAKKPGAMKKIFNTIVKKSNSFTRDDAERIIDDKIFQEIPAFEKRLPTLAVIAAVAPLLGLLGTVSGMIQLFDVITAYGSADPKLLAGGISIALITTQAGLGLAIPFMLAHHIMTRKKTNIINHLEQTAIKVLEALYPETIEKK